MKKNHACARELEETLLKEAEVLTLLNACQKRMYESTVNRDWIMLQNETAASESITESFLELEKKRKYIVHAIDPKADGTKDFYFVTASFAEADRKRVNTLFRDVKRLLLLSKTENEAFGSYVSNARTLVAGVIDAVVPARRNKIYNRRGSLASGNVESMVLNRSF